MDLIAEIYQFLFISSIVFMIYLLGDLVIKTVGRISQKNPEIRFFFSNSKRILLWMSIAIFFSYIIT
jgi:hypothetical protein